MKRIFLSLLFVLASAAALAQQTPKYVFYFIGDGMGVNQVNGTETYLAARQGHIGTQPLLFAGFPNTGLVTTQSHSHGITDSAAAGTALACGHKTYNNAIGLLTDSLTPITSVAVWARESGAAVGIATSVSVDHATPASFYAHQKHRKKYYEIGQDLTRSGFDFFGGSDFLKPDNPTPGAPDLYQQSRNAGYTIARGREDFVKKRDKAERIILLQTEQASQRDRSSLPYAIDRTEQAMTLTEITQSAIEFLMKKNAERFFCMIEGGKIDWACHANDAATAFEEVIDFDKAIGIAYDFYRQHPDETLIVVTADHETGGLALGNSNYILRTDLLAHQRLSSYDYSRHLLELRDKMGKDFDYDVVKRDLEEHFGFWRTLQPTPKQEQQLKEAYEKMMKKADKKSASLYSTEIELADLAKRILNHHAKIGWSSGLHTNGYVPVFAIGAGAEHFRGRIDNTEIPRTIARLAGYKMPEKQ